MCLQNGVLYSFKMNKEYDILTDCVFKNNLMDYITEVAKDDFVCNFIEKEEGLIQTFIRFCDSLYFVNFIYKKNDDYDCMIIINNEEHSKKLIGIGDYECKSNYIFSLEFRKKMHLINESLDFFLYDNIYNICIQTEFVTTYIDFMRNVLEYKQCDLQISYNNVVKWVRVKVVMKNKLSNNYFLAIYDIDEYLTNEISIIKKSFKDPLTKSMQKDSILEYVSDYIRLYKERPLMLIIMDLDYFKLINDTYGHSFGDLVISTAAKSIKNVISKYKDAQLGRIGGDEFLISIPFIFSREEAKEVASKIRIEIMKINYEELKSFNLSCTMGISRYPDDGADYDVLFRKADKALYRGKNKGRDCYIIYDEEMHGKINEHSTSLNLTELALNESFSMQKTNFLCKEVSELFLNDNLGSAIKRVIDNFACNNEIERINFRYEKDKEALAYSYVSENSTTDGLNEYSIKRIDHFSNYFNSDNMLHVVNTNTLKFKNVNLQQTFLRFKTNSFAIIRILENDSMVGYISYEMTSKKRVWKKDELTNFIILKEFIIISITKYYEKFNKLPQIL